MFLKNTATGHSQFFSSRVHKEGGEEQGGVREVLALAPVARSLAVVSVSVALSLAQVRRRGVGCRVDGRGGGGRWNVRLNGSAELGELRRVQERCEAPCGCGSPSLGR